MKIIFLFTGKNKIPYLNPGIDDYCKRIRHYTQLEIKVIPDIKNTKNMPESEQMKREGELILKEVKNNQYFILFDEKGEKFSSIGFSSWLNKRLAAGKELCFLTGGAYGFSEEVKKRSNAVISLSDMTFSHQMVRIIVLEQVYRAFTILRGEPYHHS